MEWEPLPTPNPKEFMVRVWAQPNQVASKMSRLVDETTALRDFYMGTAPLSEGFAGYVYKECEGPRDDGMLGFLFVKVKSQEEIDTPIEEFPIQRDDFDWPKILEEEIKIYCNDDDPNWVALSISRLAYVFIVVKLVRPRFRGATTIVVRRYWSHTPWAEEDLVSEPMQPNDVEWDLMVIRGAVKDCLHGAQKIPGLAGDGGLGRLYNLADDTPMSTEVAAYPSRTYGATNYTTWEDHIYLATQRPLRGGWLLETYEALAPPLTDIIP